MNALTRHQIDVSAENILHALLDFHESEQGKALRPIKIEKDIDIGSVERFIAGDRSEEKERTDAGTTEFGFVLPQQSDNLIAVHMIDRPKRKSVNTLIALACSRRSARPATSC
jgi:hypothetical protein